LVYTDRLSVYLHISMSVSSKSLETDDNQDHQDDEPLDPRIQVKSQLCFSYNSDFIYFTNRSN